MHWRIEAFKHTLLNFISIKVGSAREYLWRIKEKRLPKTQDGKLLFHIGCGKINSPEFINIDARKDKHIHIVTRNIFKLWMIPSNTADMIYMCHILEHIPRNNISAVLKEMHRILKPTGILRLSVPNLDCIISIYNDTNYGIEHISPALMGGQDYPENFHFEIFNQMHLEKLLIANNFKNITPWNPHEVEYHNFEDWASTTLSFNEKEYFISLNLEACKEN